MQILLIERIVAGCAELPCESFGSEANGKKITPLLEKHWLPDMDSNHGSQSQSLLSYL